MATILPQQKGPERSAHRNALVRSPRMGKRAGEYIISVERENRRAEKKKEK